MVKSVGGIKSISGRPPKKVRAVTDELLSALESAIVNLSMQIPQRE
jgi:hypothetical protein